MSWKNNIWGNRVYYKGPEERLPDVEAALDELGVTRKSMYLVLKYFELNPDGIVVLEQQFPDV